MTINVTLREVRSADLPIFFEQQQDAEARRMAAFPGRDREQFMAHWARIMGNETGWLNTIVADGEVAGNMVCWEDGRERYVGYWLGRNFWGKGIASAALGQFLTGIIVRPLKAYVAKGNVASLRVLEKCGFRIVGEEAHGPGGEEYVMELGSNEHAMLTGDPAKTGSSH